MFHFTVLHVKKCSFTTGEILQDVASFLFVLVELKRHRRQIRIQFHNFFKALSRLLEFRRNSA